jgi:hypothetical protein
MDVRAGNFELTCESHNSSQVAVMSLQIDKPDGRFYACDTEVERGTRAVNLTNLVIMSRHPRSIARVTNNHCGNGFTLERYRESVV